jgi:hypothetical protein
MDEIEQRFVVKYLYIKGCRNNKITTELQTTFHDSAISNLTLTRWIRTFKNGDFSPDDDPRAGRAIPILGPVLRKFLDRDPVSSIKVISNHFRISPPTVKGILRQELGLSKFSRRWVLHFLPHDQTQSRIDAEQYFEGIATGEKSWFQYSSYSNSMFTDSRDSVVPRIQQDISRQKV